MWRSIGDWFSWYVWGVDRCGMGPDRWGEECGGSYGSNIDFQNY